MPTTKVPDDIFDAPDVDVSEEKEAMQNLQEKAIEVKKIKGLPMELSDEQLAFLQQKTPDKFVKMRPGAGGMQVPYVEVGYVTHMLNALFGFNWDFEIEDQSVGKTQLWVRGKLTVRAGDRAIVKSQYGGSQVKYTRDGEIMDIANDLKAAASDCLKKCASMIGIANDVYWKGSKEL